MTIAAEAPLSMPQRCLGNLSLAFTYVTRTPRTQSRHSWLLRPKQLAMAGSLTLAVFLFGLIVIDARISGSVHDLPHWVPSFFDSITDYGKSGYFLWPLGILFIVLCALPPVLPRFQQRVLAAAMVRIGFLFSAIAMPSLFATIVKRMIGRARPMVTGHFDPYVFSPFIWRSDYASLPSGHATTAFAVLVAFSTLWPRARTIFLIYALLIAISRVVVTAHYPTDVAAGALVGILGALFVRRWFALRLLGFSLRPDGVPHQFPGPSLRRMKAVARNLLAD